MKKINIPHFQFHKLLNLQTKNTTSTSDLSRWLEVITNDQFIVIEKELVLNALSSLERCATTTDKIKEQFKQNWHWYI